MRLHSFPAPDEASSRREGERERAKEESSNCRRPNTYKKIKNSYSIDIITFAVDHDRSLRCARTRVPVATAMLATAADVTVTLWLSIANSIARALIFLK